MSYILRYSQWRYSAKSGYCNLPQKRKEEEEEAYSIQQALEWTGAAGNRNLSGGWEVGH